MSWKDVVASLQERKLGSRTKRVLPSQAEIARKFKSYLGETGDPIHAYENLVAWVGEQASPGETREKKLDIGHKMLHASVFVPEGYYGE